MKTYITYILIFLYTFFIASSSITVTNGENSSIPTILLSENSIIENVSPGTIVGEISFTGASSVESEEFLFTNGTGSEDNKNFTIVGHFLNISFSPDYEKKTKYNIRIQTKRPNGTIYQESFTIKILDLSETLESTIGFEEEGQYINTVGNWNRGGAKKHTGDFALKSENNEQADSESCFEVSHTQNVEGNFSFYYSLSSEEGGDFLNFYIDDTKQESWSGILPWTMHTSENIPKGLHVYRWCYKKNSEINEGSDNAYIDSIKFPIESDDIYSPEITNSNFASGALLPGGSHNIIIDYNDYETGIDSESIQLQLQKWNETKWGEDISEEYIDGIENGEETSEFTFSKLSFGKYLYTFSVSDKVGNIGTVSRMFYIDKPEMIITNEPIDMSKDLTLANRIRIEVLTVGAPFEITFSNTASQELPLLSGNGETEKVTLGYQRDSFEGTIKPLGENELIASENLLINTNGNRNTYTYTVDVGHLMDIYSGDYYTGNLKFNINLDY